MLLYGGLLQSRISNDTTDQLTSRFDRMVQAWKDSGMKAKMYASNVITRIPNENGDVDEPWYSARYGQDIFTYSFYTDKY